MIRIPSKTLLVWVFVSMPFWEVIAQETDHIINGYVSLSLKNHATMQVLDLNEKYLNQKKAAVGWDNPKIMMGYGLPPIETRTGAQVAKLGVMQRLPLWGTLDHQRDILDSKNKENHYAKITQAFEIKRIVKSLWMDLYMVRKKIHLYKKKMIELRSIQNYLNERYLSQQSDISAVYTIDLDIKKTEGMVLQLQEKELDTEELFKMISRIAVSAEIVTPPQIDLVIPYYALSKDSLMVYRITSNTHLKKLKQQEITQEHIIQKTKKDRYFPKVNLRMDYAMLNSTNPNPFYIGSEISIPIFIDQNHSEVEAQIIQREKTNRNYSESFHHLEVKISSEQAILSKILAREKNQKDILKLLKEWSNQKNEAYQSETIDYHNYIYAKIRLLDEMVSLEDIINTKWKKIFHIEALLQPQ